ncbi:MAG: nicotinate-nucleotide adenylyltransferase [Betaproteobacteria bacterium]|nr:nicotinate-nucleotide adenylyltransferase [Betaproteobacteria bacterium]
MNLSPPFRAVGFLGGTFDPVHEGHLAIARAVGVHFGLDQVRLVPAQAPVHRPAPVASAADRLAMLRLAVAPYPELAIDTREFDSRERNYTLLTLQSLRAELPEAALLWIIGEDAFALLPGWHRWRELFDAANFVVINREGSGVSSHWPQALQAAVATRWADSKQALTVNKAGLVCRLTLPPQPASSTKIRAALAAGRADDITDLLPTAVLAYIARHGLYQAGDYGS